MLYWLLPREKKADCTPVIQRIGGTTVVGTILP